MKARGGGRYSARKVGLGRKIKIKFRGNEIKRRERQEEKVSKL